jgi:aminomethyltransferase
VPSDSPRRTALFDRHVLAGARLIEFAGWEMPASYGGASAVREEHVAVRQDVGIFDVSHMGQIETSGPRAAELLQLLLSNDVSGVPVGGAQYSVLCREDGGVLDDLFSYRLDADRWLTVTNAANHARDLEWFRARAGDVEVRDRSDDHAMLAVQGPRARELVQAISDAPLPARMSAEPRRMLGAEVLVCGTGYTGEDGVELLLHPDHAPALWDELVRRGARPAGLAARDTLRLEACYCLYGNELSTERGPIEAGLGWCCKESTDFIGAAAVRAVREAGPRESLVAFAIDGPGIARHGNPIAGGGIVTSGTLAPCLQAAVGLAYVPAEHAATGTSLQIDVRGKMRQAVVRDKPLYRRGQ